MHIYIHIIYKYDVCNIYTYKYDVCGIEPSTMDIFVEGLVISNLVILANQTREESGNGNTHIVM